LQRLHPSQQVITFIISSTRQHKLVGDTAVAQECATMIESLQWETAELRDTLVDLARKQDQQLLAFYRSLKGFPSSFINVASKYAKYSKNKK
jgi:hypothetical protein